MDTPCSARSCGLLSASRSRLARLAIGVLPINTSMELSITLSISTRSTGLSGKTAIGKLLFHFVKKRFLQHPVYHLFDGFRLFAEIAVRLNASHGPDCGGAPPYTVINGYLSDSRAASLYGVNFALIAHVVREQHRNLNRREIEIAQTGTRLL